MNSDLTVRICQADVPNKNGRIYSTEVLQSIVAKATTEQVFGTLGMPQSGSLNRDLASHMIADLRLEYGFLVGKVTVLNTERGKLLEECLSSIVQPSFRLAGRGKVDSNGVVAEFEIDSVNAVYDGA